MGINRAGIDFVNLINLLRNFNTVKLSEYPLLMSENIWLARQIRQRQLFPKGVSLAVKMFGRLPQPVQHKVLSVTLNQALEQSIQDGELDFMVGRRCAIRVNEAEQTWVLAFDGKQLNVVSNEHKGGELQHTGLDAEVVFSGNSTAFLELVCQKVDPDTLFFQRQLVVEGDTELGLYLKNLLDALDWESLPKLFQVAIGVAKKIS